VADAVAVVDVVAAAAEPNPPRNKRALFLASVWLMPDGCFLEDGCGIDRGAGAPRRSQWRHGEKERPTIPCRRYFG